MLIDTHLHFGILKLFEKVIYFLSVIIINLYEVRINSKILIINTLLWNKSICIIHKSFRHLYMFPYYVNV